MKHPEQTAVWRQHASQWSHVAPPLKPSPEDTALTLSALKGIFAARQEPCRIAVLGVTPELVQLPWPQGVKLDAFDHSPDMIAQVWQPHPTVCSSVHEVAWQALPLHSGSLHATVGDASLNVLPEMVMYSAVLKELHRVLAETGRVVIRCFIRPDMAESLPAVVAAVLSGQVGSFHVLKWRLAMALASVSGAPVGVATIHRIFEASFPSRSALSEATGWPLKQIDTIDAYRDSPTRYTFPTISQMRAQCEPWFDVVDVAYGAYELADRCPTLTLVRKNTGGRRE